MRKYFMYLAVGAALAAAISGAANAQSCGAIECNGHVNDFFAYSGGLLLRTDLDESTAPVHAGYEGGARTIEKVLASPSRLEFYFNPAPTVCGDGSYYGWGHMHIPITQTNADQLYAMVLTVHQTGDTINGIWFDGDTCSNTITPKITSLGKAK